MKILVVNPPFLPKFSRAQRSPAVTKSGTLYYPVWLAYATGALEKAGHEVRLIDAPANDLDLSACLQIAKDFQPELLVLDAATGSIYNDIQVGVALKGISPGAFLVFVGTHVSALPEESLALDPAIDAVVRGEYDYTLRSLAEALAAGTDLRLVAGLVFRDQDHLVRNADAALIEDLDEIPFVSEVYRRHLDLKKYFNPNALYPLVMIVSGRGCRQKCTFCVYPQTMFGHRYRVRSVNNVVDELEYISTQLPEVRGVFFEDDTLVSDKARCRELSEEILRRRLKISWSTNARADVDKQTLLVMKRAGLKTLCVGFESGDQQLLDNISKGTTIEGMKQFVKDAREVGILVHGCFMAGLPGETRQSLGKTLQLAKELNPDTAQFYPIMVYPGTKAFKWYTENNCLVTQDFSKWLTPEGLHNTVIQLPNLTSAQLVAWCDDARRQFYLRPSYIAAKVWQLILHPSEIRRKLKSVRTFFTYLTAGSQPQSPSC